MSTFYVFFYFRSGISFVLRYSHLFSKKFRHHRPLRAHITVGGVGDVGGVRGDFSHTLQAAYKRPMSSMLKAVMGGKDWCDQRSESKLSYTFPLNRLQVL